MRTLIATALLLCPALLFAQSSPSSATDSNPTSQNAGQLPPPTPSEQAKVEQDLRDIHFDFNRANLRLDERATLQADADWLNAHPDVFVTIEGDADERGDIVYNVALSDQRASVTRDALISMGVSQEHVVFATGWGKLYPVCTDSDEACWSRNRRAHFELWSEPGAAQASLTSATSGNKP